MTQQHQSDTAGLPSLPPPDASDDERARAIMARMAARFGGPGLEDYRRAYAGFSAEWPGHDTIHHGQPATTAA